MRHSFFLLAVLLLTWSAAPAQRKVKSKTQNAPAATLAESRLRPQFGGLSVAEAQGLLGPAFLAGIDRSFASRAEASAFFATKGYEYLSENQPDTAMYRFNLAWLLDPQNPDAYHGLGVLSSQQPTPDESIRLLSQALALAPDRAGVLSDLGTSYLIRYERQQKKKDLDLAFAHLTKATAADPANANAWQQLARAHYQRADYPGAWAALHKARSLSMASIDFGFLTELQAKLPDPQGLFK